MRENEITERLAALAELVTVSQSILSSVLEADGAEPIIEEAQS